MSNAHFRYCFNPFWEDSPSQWTEDFPQDSLAEVRRFHESLSEYEPTPLVKLDNLASQLGLGSLLVKDESCRLGLNAFKGLGASYAIHKLLETSLPEQPVLAAATAGNHGRAVAWMARKMGLEAVIFVPSDTSPLRLEAIRREGPTVVPTEGSYDDSVRRMAEESSKKNYLVVADIGYEDYTEIPKLITRGYFTLFSEVEEQIESMNLPTPEFLFLQGGVGTFASSGIAYFTVISDNPNSPTIATVEPLEADCLLASAASIGGFPRCSSGTLKTRMSGLNCGFPSTVAWPIVRSGASLLLAVDEETAMRATELLSNPLIPGSAVHTSPSGAAGLAGLLACCGESGFELRDLLGLGPDSCVLIVNTEGPLSGLEAVRR
jgi:diaminopropionate ammonia-lyase